VSQLRNIFVRTAADRASEGTQSIGTIVAPTLDRRRTRAGVRIDSFHARTVMASNLI
jgi:hypothetical protein